MSDPNQTFADSPVAEKSFPWGCLLGSCLSVVVLIGVGIFATGYAAYYFYKGQLDAYTSDQPAAIPAVDYDDQEVAAIKQRIEDFKTAIDQGESPQQLVLTADDINAMISGEKELRGRLFVSIENGEIKGQASFPADVLPLGKGRYFNGSVTLKASLENGVLIVTIDDAEVNGKPVPAEFIANMQDKNLAKDIYNDPEAAEILRKFKSLTIMDDKIVLTPTDQSEQKPNEAPPAEITGTDGTSGTVGTVGTAGVSPADPIK